MTTIHEKLQPEREALKAAAEAYNARLKLIQEACEHPTVLKFEDAMYYTTRVCEECGKHETHCWDSHYKYKDQNLVKRAYEVRHPEIVRAKANPIDTSRWSD